MNRRKLVKSLAVGMPALYLSSKLKAADLLFSGRSNSPVSDGRFQPSWESLKQYVVPEWYQNARFGIWAHSPDSFHPWG